MKRRAQREPAVVTTAERYKTVVSSGQSALTAFLTLNGGATLAFLAFLGHLWEKSGQLPGSSGGVFISAMQLFIYGTFLAVAAYGTIFLANCLSYVKWRRTTGWVFVVTLLCGFGSLGCFLAASGRAVEAFGMVNRNQGAAPPRPAVP